MHISVLQQARLPLSIDLAALQQEVDALAGWQSHFNTRHYTGNWSALSLRAPGGQAGQIIPDARNQQAYADTGLLSDCPYLRGWLSALDCELLSVRLLNLAAGAHIKEHRDHELCFEQGEARLHIPVHTNLKVFFYINNEQILMEGGSCWYVNANLSHRVSNEGPTDRIHLVIDCVVNDWLRDLFRRGEQTFYRPADEGTLAVIAELRRQDTAVSNQLADELEKQLSLP